MEAWAKVQLARGQGPELNIRPSTAFRMLRRQTCFSEASDYEIRRAVWKHAAVLNLSIKKPDEGKHNYWPPASRARFENMHRFLDEDLPSIPEEYYNQWNCPYGPGWITIKPEKNGLPNKKKYIACCWKKLVETAAKNNLPIPPYKWPRLRVRLLSPYRLGKAAQELPYRCPLCLIDNHGRQYIHGRWLFENEDYHHDQIFCWTCEKIVDDLRRRVEWQRKRASRISLPRKISRDVAQRALKELGIEAPKRESLQAIQQILNQPETEVADA